MTDPPSGEYDPLKWYASLVPEMQKAIEEGRVISITWEDHLDSNLLWPPTEEPK